MASDTGRDDFIIAIRSAFLKKGTRQKFSLFTLLIISILVLSLEYFKSGPIDKFRSITKDIIFKGSFFISEPFVFIKTNYHNFKDIFFIDNLFFASACSAVWNLRVEARFDHFQLSLLLIFRRKRVIISQGELLFKKYGREAGLLTKFFAAGRSGRCAHARGYSAEGRGSGAHCCA